MYASIIAEDGNILRLAHSYSGVLYNLGSQIPAILIAVIAALVLSLFLSDRVSKAVTNPSDKFIDGLPA